MNFVDTNYFLRFLLADVASQHTIATHLFEKAAKKQLELCTTTIVFFEINWVLSSLYDFQKDKIAAVLKKILEMPFVHFDERDLLEASLLFYQHSTLSLEDCYNVMYARMRGITKDHFKTFDKKLMRVIEKHLA